jgi:hypothetical protein
MYFVNLLEVNKRNGWFQQDGTTRHAARNTTALLRELFGEKIISKSFSPLGLLTYIHQISLCGVISKDMSTTVILTP